MEPITEAEREAVYQRLLDQSRAYPEMQRQLPQRRHDPLFIAYLDAAVASHRMGVLCDQVLRAFAEGNPIAAEISDAIVASVAHVTAEINESARIFGVA